MDAKIIQVALNVLENILRLGEQDGRTQSTINPYAVVVEECYGMENSCISLLLTIYLSFII